MPQRTVLVINSGSSSIKYQLVDPDSGAALAAGLVERIGQESGCVTHKAHGDKFVTEGPVADHKVGLAKVIAAFADHGPDLAQANVVAVGHRVVQGGDSFGGPALVTPQVEAIIEGYFDLAPLHNPANLLGIKGAQAAFPDIAHVVVFDTAFFQQLPPAAHTYAIPREVAAKARIRRYGAHGTSHQYVSAHAAEFLGADPADFSVIVAHLGNGASMSAVRNGHAIDTSMGLTPLEGLVMGTRSGDLDPAILIHLGRTEGMSFDDLDTMLNRQSGMLALSGSTDMRDVNAAIEAGDERATVAMEVYTHRIKGYVGNYYAQLGHLDAIAFTAGIGENDDVVRAMSLAGLEELGIEIDAARNAGRKSEACVISTDSSRVKVVVIPTNEELAIARQTIEVISAR